MFIAGATAASLVGVNKTPANFYWHRLRQLMAQNLAYFAPLDGEVEVDESDSSVVAPRAAKCWFLACSSAMAGFMRRRLPDAKGETLLPIIEKKVRPDSIVYSDRWRGCNALDVSGFKHYRSNHSVLFANRHSNGIENFWNQAKRH